MLEAAPVLNALPNWHSHSAMAVDGRPDLGMIVDNPVTGQMPTGSERSSLAAG